jgi:hypothetical protein
MPRNLPLRALLFAAIFTPALLGLVARHRAFLAEREEDRLRTVERLGSRPVAFFGDSHVECSVLEDEEHRLLNVGTSSEHYVFTLQKLRLLRPRTAVVGVGVHNFQPYYLGTLGPVFLSNYDFWAPHLLPEERRDVVSSLDLESRWFARLRGVVPFLGSSFQETLWAKRKGLGGFVDRGTESDVGDEALRVRLEEAFHAASAAPLAIQAEYLDRVLAYGEREGIRMVLLSAPVCRRYREAIPPAAEQAFRGVIGGLSARRRFRHWDYSTMPVEDRLFRDPDHLNLPGAEWFTRELLCRLEREGDLEATAACLP